MSDAKSESLFTKVAKELAGSFKRGKRESGEEFYAIRDDAPAWVKAADVGINVHRMVDDRLPDDWIYEHAYRLADAMADYGLDDVDAANDASNEITDGLVDVYNSARFQWLADNVRNADLIDEACTKLGSTDETDIATRIGLGQYYVLGKIFNALIDILENEITDRENGAE